MPKLRFPGFEGEWHNDYIGNLSSYIKGASLSKADISENGTPFLLYGELYTTYKEVTRNIKRKTQRVVGEEYYSKVGDVVIPTSGETPEEIATATCIMIPGVILAGDLNIFRTRNIDGRFFSYLINHKVNNEISRIAQGKSVVHIKGDEISKILIKYPDSREQTKILTFLELLAARIDKQERLIETLKKYKRGVFEAIFSQRLRLVPKEEQKSWKAFKLSDFATRITRKNSGVTDIPLTISAQYGLIDQRDFFSKVVASTDMGGYYLLHNGEYAYNRSTSNDYPFGSIKRLELYDKGAVSTLYLCFSINENVVMNDLVRWYFESSQWHQGINEICAEGARNHGLLNVPTDGFFSTIHILPSDTEEQARIAMFLSRIHYKLVQAQKELEKLICLRNGLLQQLFI